MVRLLLPVFAMSVAALLCAPWAFADGCYFVDKPVGRAASAVSSGRQEAVLVREQQTTTVILRTHFKSDAGELAWVVPVPAKPRAIRARDDELFDKLEHEAAPSFWTREYRSKGFFGCGCAALTEEARVERGLKVEATGVAGMFQYAVLSADDADELTKWLNENRYSIPASAGDVVRSYVGRGWYWLAMKIRPEQREAASLAPHPISYTYDSPDLVFPLIISRISAGRQNETVLYVLAKDRYECENWTNATVDPAQVRLERGSASGTNYESLFAEKMSPGHTFVTECATKLWWSNFNSKLQYAPVLCDLLGWERLKKDDPPRMVTRLRAVMGADSMDRDVKLRPISSRFSPDVRPEFYIRQATATETPTRAPVAAACIAVGAALRTRRRGRRAGLGVLVVGLALCATL